MSLMEYTAALEAEEAALIAFEESGGYLGATIRAAMGTQLGVLGAYLGAHALGIRTNPRNRDRPSVLQTQTLTNAQTPSRKRGSSTFTQIQSEHRPRLGVQSQLSLANISQQQMAGYTYKRKRTAPRRSYKRSYGKRKFASKRATTNRIKKVVYSVAEKKYIDQALTMVAPNSATWSFQVLGPPLLQGTGNAQRTGNTINVTSIQYDEKVTPSTGFVGSALRCIIFLIRNNKGSTAPPAATDIWANDRPTTFRNREKINEFIMLKDWTTVMPLGQSVPISTLHNIKVGKVFRYVGNLGTTADLQGYNLVLGCCSTSAAAANLVCDGKFRINFTDM